MIKSSHRAREVITQKKINKKFTKQMKNYSSYVSASTLRKQVTNSYKTPQPKKALMKQDTFIIKSEKFDISVPTSSVGSITLNKIMPQVSKMAATALNDKYKFSVSLPNQGSNTFSGKASISSDNSIVYANYGEDTDVVVQAFKDSVKILTVLNSVDSPSEYIYDVSIPVDGSLKKIDNGGILVLDKDKKMVGGFTPPWAIDKNGKEVPTHYEIRGHMLVQVIEHLSVNVEYPVVADPYLGKYLVNSYRWVWQSNYQGYTMRVQPTNWARNFPRSYIIGMWGWDELYDWAKGPYGLNYNLGGMRDQFICHQQFATSKAIWNLDEYRRDVSYYDTVVTYHCNPPIVQ